MECSLSQTLDQSMSQMGKKTNWGFFQILLETRETEHLSQEFQMVQGTVNIVISKHPLLVVLLTCLFS